MYILAMAVFFLFFAVSNAPAPVTTPREDPLVGFYYGLEVEGIISAFFSEVSGIGSENEVAESKVVNEKGVQIILKIPGRLKWTDVTLKRGITANKHLWNWRKMVENGNIKEARKNFTIIMYDQTLTPVAQWDFKNGWPSKIEAPAAGSTEGAFESITIVHEYMVRSK